MEGLTGSSTILMLISHPLVNWTGTVTDELDHLKFGGFPQTSYSPGLSQCGFSRFGILKQKTK
jgi:hypothetical protein